MRTSLHDPQIIEKYLSGILSGTELAAFRDRLSTDPHFQLQVESQKEAYQTIKYYGRAELRKELKRVRKRLFTHPDKARFRLKINRIFNYGPR
ncbi:MAG: hypothetical protein MI921_12180 [Cytophagales bacterium]|nr:hypothetical protein [Cytophagales bacterium]